MFNLVSNLYQLTYSRWLADSRGDTADLIWRITETDVCSISSRYVIIEWPLYFFFFGLKVPMFFIIQDLYKFC